MRQSRCTITPAVVRSPARDALQRALPRKGYGRLVPARRLGTACRNAGAWNLSRLLGSVLATAGAVILFWFLVGYDPTVPIYPGYEDVEGMGGRVYNAGRMNLRITGAVAGGFALLSGSVLMARSPAATVR